MRWPGRVTGVLVLLVGFVVVGLAGWLSVGLRPVVAQGSQVAPGGGVVLLDPGTARTRYVLDGDHGELRVTVRNAGPAPFTVLGLADGLDPRRDVLTGARLALVSPSTSASSVDVSADPVLLGPDQEAVVALQAQVPPCGTYDAGTVLVATSLDLRIRSLGLTTTRTVPLTAPLTIRFATARPSPTSCE